MLSRLSSVCVGAAFAEDDLQFLAPVFAEGDEFPVDLGGEIAQDREIGGMDAQRRCCQKQAWRQGRNFCSGKVAFAFERRERPVAAGGALAIGIEGADADPVVESLQWEMQVFVGFEFDDDEAAVAIEGEQIEHAAIAGRESAGTCE